jgi:hypothetical protein
MNFRTMELVLVFLFVFLGPVGMCLFAKIFASIDIRQCEPGT